MTKRNGLMDPDDLLCEEESVRVVLKTTAFELGFLQNVDDTDLEDPEAFENAFANPEADAEGVVQERKNDLKVGTKLDVPLWLARELASRRYVSVQPGTQYQPSFNDKVKAGPLEVNLRRRYPYYYAAGTRIATVLPGAASQRLRTQLGQSFVARFGALLGESTSRFDILEESERQVLRDVSAAKRRKLEWFSQRSA
eukprot:TRINITY_DN8328_c0_g1_i1.p1 TRINITY_DN8328_c0_g1~~TRINITY_DN8328_c0_g1_i1.p1  ORF type:complete len:220 (+),score=45.40 TRINITY_DN8328_c0_g1_i1:70-660(+)